MCILKVESHIHRLKLLPSLLFIPVICIEANTTEINGEAQKVIYQYAEIVDSRNFSKLETIMWSNFSMTGDYDLSSIEDFKQAMNYLASTYSRTMHFIGNIDGSWDGDIYSGKTYCVASHIYKEKGKMKKLDMGIIYEDTLERRDGVVKFVNRKFNLQWQKTDILEQN